MTTTDNVTQAEAQIEVIEADREAAADVIWCTSDSPALWYAVKHGNDDGHRLVQAFARHRLAFAKEATPSASVEGVARDEAVRALEIVRSYTDADDDTSYRADDREGCLDAVFAEADRALKYIAALTLPVPSAPQGGEA